MAGSGVLWAILRRPRLWGEAVRTLAALAPRAWWARRPHIPLPEREYLEWRLATAYGSSEGQMSPSDVIAYLEWRRCFRRATVRSGVASG